MGSKRFDYAKRVKARALVKRAVQKAHVPGAPSLGTTPGPGFTNGTTISPQIDGNNYVNEDGVPIRPFTLGVDTLGDPNRPLCVKGNFYKYYAG